MFYTGIFCEKLTAQIFLRLYIYEFLSGFLNTGNIHNRHYELYISVMSVMQVYIVIEIQLY